MQLVVPHALIRHKLHTVDYGTMLQRLYKLHFRPILEGGLVYFDGSDPARPTTCSPRLYRVRQQGTVVWITTGICDGSTSVEDIGFIPRVMPMTINGSCPPVAADQLYSRTCLHF